MTAAAVALTALAALGVIVAVLAALLATAWLLDHLIGDRRGIDRATSTSRQHWIDTGTYLSDDEGEHS